jgi:acid phosphatase family membrane protein YuiD
MKTPELIEVLVGEKIEGNLLLSLRYGGMPSRETFSVVVENLPLGSSYSLYFRADSKFLSVSAVQKIYEIKDVTSIKITLEERANESWPPDESILHSRR